jgi:hypothetical protein
VRSPFQSLLRAREVSARLARAAAARAAARVRERLEEVERVGSAMESWQAAAASGGVGLAPSGWRVLAWGVAALRREAQRAEDTWRAARDLAVEARAALAAAEQLEARWRGMRTRALARSEQSASDDLAAARWWREAHHGH